MTAYASTAANLAAAISGRTAQDVNVCSSSHFRGQSSYVVTLDGAQTFYEISKSTLGRLREGWTPADLDLEPMTDGELIEHGLIDDDYNEGDIHDLAAWQRDVTPRRL